MEQIKTKRLLLRNFTNDDYNDLYEFLSQRKDDYFEGYPDITYESGKEHLEYRLNNDDFIAIELITEKKVIGNIYFANRSFESKELGYIINKNYQRNKYATEAIETLIKYSFSQGIHRIYAECDPLNECSWYLLEHLQFKKEACFKKNVYFHKDNNGNPIWQDTYVYALLNSNEK